MRKLTRFAVAALAFAALSGFAAAPASAALNTATQTARPAAVKPAAAVNYTVRVHTGDVQSAGTDSYVWVKLRGTEGTSGWLYLDNAHNNFERGQIDTFTFTQADLGTIRSVDVSFERSGDNPGWYLDKIVVAGDGQSRTYPYYKWITWNSTVNIPAV